MRMTLQADYALRLLMHLAVESDRLTTISNSAERYGISKNHLMKVANTLVQSGYVESVRGRSGGLRLARSSSQINVGEVVRSMNEGAGLVACFPAGAGGCIISPSCRLKSVFSEALGAFFDVLDGYTLESLVAANTPLRSILSSRAP